jgi:hypothetical protein
MGMYSNPHTGFYPQTEYEGDPQINQAGQMVLAFKIPDAPYSDDAFARLHGTFEVIEGVHATLEIFAVEVAGLLGLGLAVGAPLAGLLAEFMALGSGYAEARAEVAKKRIVPGFALGVVTGAARRNWPYVKSLFWEKNPEENTFYPENGVVAQKAFNLGLVSGFVQGRELTSSSPTPSSKERFFWQSILRARTPGDRMKYPLPWANWPKELWPDWFYRAAGIFIQQYVKQ